MAAAFGGQNATGGVVVFVAWQPHGLHQGWRPVGNLDYHAGLYRFRYINGAAKPGFRRFPGFSDLYTVYESEDLFPLFANRLLAKARPEYAEFLRWGGFADGVDAHPLSELGVTEGLRQTDSVEVFPCPQPDAEGWFVNTFFLHGLQRLPAASLDRAVALKPGESLKLMLDPQSDHNQHAIAVRTGDERMTIGYFPHYLAHDAWRLLKVCDPLDMRLSVVQVNSGAPLQNRVLCRLRSWWPEGYAPCSGEDFQPIVAHRA